MARKLTPDTAANVGHNVGDLKEIIREIDVALAPLEDRKAELNQQIREAKSRLKEFDIPVKTFNYWRGIFRLDDDDLKQDRIAKSAICAEAFNLDQLDFNEQLDSNVVQHPANGA